MGKQKASCQGTPTWLGRCPLGHQRDGLTSSCRCQDTCHADPPGSRPVPDVMERHTAPEPGKKALNPRPAAHPPAVSSQLSTDQALHRAKTRQRNVQSPAAGSQSQAQEDTWALRGNAAATSTDGNRPQARRRGRNAANAMKAFFFLTNSLGAPGHSVVEPLPSAQVMMLGS